MNYKAIHDSIITRASNRIYDSKLYQNHHIIPRCEDVNSTEMVPITIKEHTIIHLLRYKLGFHLGNYKAYLLMKGFSDIETHLVITSNAGKIGGKITKDNNLGIFSYSWDRSAETTRRHRVGIIVPYLKNNSELASHLGKLSVLSGHGIHSPNWDRATVNKEHWESMPDDEYARRSEINRINAVSGGQISKELGTNFSSWDKEKHLAACSAGGKVSGKMLHWTNGVINRKSNDCPGEGWYRGRIAVNVRKVVKNKWWTNGIEQKMCELCPNGWVSGMIKSKR